MSRVEIKANIVSLEAPVTDELARKSVDALNVVFNSREFREELSQCTFNASNRPSFSKDGKTIAGTAVYDEFIRTGVIEIDLTVRKLWRPWKRFVSKTMGETNPSGKSIITYTWWLNGLTDKRLLADYSTHVGHEIFHTSYFGYIHDPVIGTRRFVEDRDVTYKIDQIVEKLVKELVIR